MSPRSNRRRPDQIVEVTEAAAAAYGGPEQLESGPDGDWMVRRVTGSASTKPYRCPGCDQEIRPATPHVVAWPADGLGGLDDRRHWHSSCWTARTRRQPGVRRSRNAPRY